MDWILIALEMISLISGTVERSMIWMPVWAGLLSTSGSIALALIQLR